MPRENEKSDVKERIDRRRIQELARRFRISEDKINYILGKYKTMEKFLEVYRQGKLDEQDIKILQENLQKQINIGGTNNRGLVALASYVSGQNRKVGYLTDNNFTFFDTAKLLKILDALPKDERVFVEDSFGFVSGKGMTKKDIAKKHGVTRYMVDTRLRTGTGKAIKHSIDQGAKLIDVNETMQKRQFTQKGRVLIEAIKDRIFSSNLVFQPDSEYVLVPDDIDEDELRIMVDIIRALKKREDMEEAKGSEEVATMQLPQSKTITKLQSLRAKKVIIEEQGDSLIADIKARRAAVAAWNRQFGEKGSKGE